MNALDRVDEIVEWQQENEGACSRCGTVMESPRTPNLSHIDDRIHLCDGCAFIDALLYARDVKLRDKDGIREAFLDERDWLALGGDPRGE